MTSAMAFGVLLLATGAVIVIIGLKSGKRRGAAGQCRHCGAANAPQAQFCARCGKSID
jgi:hypothetical protein